MLKYTVEVDGMMCGMCESHCNDSIRRAFADVKKVTSSHAKKQTVIIIDRELDEDEIRKTITALGYDVGAITKEPYEKKKFLGIF